MKRFLIVANWKLNGNLQMIDDFFEYFKLHLKMYSKKHIIVFAPPIVYLEKVQFYTKNMVNFFTASQNVDIHLKGPFTGEVSLLMLKDIGVKYVIIGHSERRLLHNESSDIIAKKFHLIKNLNLIPILCIGETNEEKKQGKTKQIIEQQLNLIFKYSGKSAFENAVIAYEPIWAIGSGLSAEPEKVQLIHKFIKNYIVHHSSSAISGESVIIQYGGSVDRYNTKKFLEQEDIGGLLIGGASLRKKELLEIIKIANTIF